MNRDEEQMKIDALMNPNVDLFLPIDERVWKDVPPDNCKCLGDYECIECNIVKPIKREITEREWLEINFS